MGTLEQIGASLLKVSGQSLFESPHPSAFATEVSASGAGGSPPASSSSVLALVPPSVAPPGAGSPSLVQPWLKPVSPTTPVAPTMPVEPGGRGDVEVYGEAAGRVFENLRHGLFTKEAALNLGSEIGQRILEGSLPIVVQHSITDLVAAFGERISQTAHWSQEQKNALNLAVGQLLDDRAMGNLSAQGVLDVFDMHLTRLEKQATNASSSPGTPKGPGSSDPFADLAELLVRKNVSWSGSAANEPSGAHLLHDRLNTGASAASANIVGNEQPPAIERVDPAHRKFLEDNEPNTRVRERAAEILLGHPDTETPYSALSRARDEALGTGNGGGGGNLPPVATSATPDDRRPSVSMTTLTDDQRQAMANLAQEFKLPASYMELVYKTAKVAVESAGLNRPGDGDIYIRARQALEMMQAGRSSAWALTAITLSPEMMKAVLFDQNDYSLEQLQRIALADQIALGAVSQQLGEGPYINEFLLRSMRQAMIKEGARGGDPAAHLEQMADIASRMPPGLLQQEVATPTGSTSNLQFVFGSMIQDFPLDVVSRLFTRGEVSAEGIEVIQYALGPTSIPSATLDLMIQYVNTMEARPSTAINIVRGIEDGTYRTLEAAREAERTAIAAQSATEVSIADLEQAVEAKLGDVNTSQLAIVIDSDGTPFVTEGTLPAGLNNDLLQLNLTIGRMFMMDEPYILAETSGDSYTQYSIEYQQGSGDGWKTLTPHTGVQLPEGASVRFKSPEQAEWIEIRLP